MKTDRELLEEYRLYLTNCLEDELFDLTTIEDWYDWKEDELDRIASQ